MAVNLFFTDLDGTLLVDHALDEHIHQGIASIQAQGGHVIFDTGRPSISVWNLKGPIDWMICCNGALIYDDEGELVSEKRIPPRDLRDFLMAFGNETVQFITKDAVFCNKSMRQAARSFLKRKGLPSLPAFLIPSWVVPVFINSWQTSVPAGQMLAQPVVKIEVSGADPAKLERWLASHPGLVNAPSTSGLAEITVREATKGQAALEVLERLQASPEQAAAFGDGLNDLPLLETIRESYAPETGTEQARKTAAHVLAMEDPYAVIHKMEELIRG